MSRGFEQARTFYASLLGWEVQEIPMPDGAYTLFQAASGGAGGGTPTPGL